jgi:hypothetical protein
MREIECPHCLNVNRVAGRFEAGKAEGAGQVVLYCAFCGETFTPKEAIWEERHEADKHVCREVQGSAETKRRGQAISYDDGGLSPCTPQKMRPHREHWPTR